MTRSSKPLILAVDGGGTRCRLVLSDGETRHKVEVGAANVSTDFDAACRELQRGLEALISQSGRSVDDIMHAPTYLGLAGITGDAIAQKLASALPCRHVRIEDDRGAALRGALGPADGFVAHCGTGSFIATQQAGTVRLAGGWGPVLGDQASAQWIGKRALSKALDHVDGVIASSQLAQDLLSHHGGAPGLVRAAAQMTPTEFGAIAPQVTELASHKDALAVTLLQDGADYLAGMMRTMGWCPGLPVCLTGGIGPHYAPYLPQDMQAALTQPLGDPLSGALALARAFQEEIEHECS
ncbi:BadF/BadG/BcrA/BcrD ATPase family protein [Ruegeria sp. SCPT10]|uniref:BadF/BadG/BcrA/BcrD ATPase family protein n=1 Tax=Ruegeria sp. SCP10 TaxID=3141377 RepID=UPI00333CD721